jgi:hypothetical protein
LCFSGWPWSVGGREMEGGRRVRRQPEGAGLGLAPRLAGRAEPVRGGFGACGERWGVGAGLPGWAVRPWGGVQAPEVAKGAVTSCVAVGLL